MPFVEAAPKGTKTQAQVRAIYGRAKTRTMDDDQLHALVTAETGKDSIRMLDRKEADKVIVALGGTPLYRNNKSRRTTQHQRKQKGVKQIVTSEQLEFMSSLASQLDWKKETLTNFCQRQIKRGAPSTTEEANKVIEGMKAILSRRPERQQV